MQGWYFARGDVTNPKKLVDNKKAHILHNCYLGQGGWQLKENPTNGRSILSAWAQNFLLGLYEVWDTGS